MENIGAQKIWSYFDSKEQARPATSAMIRGGNGHQISTYFKLAMKIAELQFKNREYVLLFRGQHEDYKTTKHNTALKPSIFRLEGKKPPSAAVLEKRFNKLRVAEQKLIDCYAKSGLPDAKRVKRQRIIRWAILQHYRVCPTPLLDVSQSLRIAASMASHDNETDEAYVFVIGVPNLSGAVTASSEAGLQIIRLSSACPPAAVRPHIQEGYLLGEYPEFSDFQQRSDYSYYELDFGRRLVAKFRFNPKTFWSSKNYPQASNAALYPTETRDPLLQIAAEIEADISKIT